MKPGARRRLGGSPAEMQDHLYHLDVAYRFKTALSYQLLNADVHDLPAPGTSVYATDANAHFANALP